MTIPIVIVPGILGTRLESGGRTVWDPDDGLSWSNARGVWELRNPGTPASPSSRTSPVLTAWFRLNRIVNGPNLVWGMGYEHLVRGLASRSFSRNCGGVRIYCAGYDWRQSNIVSARRLRHVVERAIRETGARRVILVAHSMGGIVARLFCRYSRIARRPARNFVQHLYLLGSPTHGASKAYRALRQSFVNADDISDIALDPYDESALDFTGRAVARIIRRFNSVYELLPTQAFCAANPDWLTFNTRRAGIPDASDASRLYNNHWTGVSAPARFLRHRDAFDRGLGTYMPPRTTIVFASEVPTRTKMRIDSDRSLREAGTDEENMGDGTVPTYSGAASASDPRIVRHDLKRIDHGGLANDRLAVRYLMRHIRRECSASGVGDFAAVRSHAVA